ncbi:MAG: type IV secretory system conjugative DNA transfer family protein, partial [Christensenellaceae bacterium]
MSIIERANLIGSYEKTHIRDFRKVTKEFIPFSRLGETSGGFPVAVIRQDGVLYESLAPDQHVCIVGTTGSGKTTGLINHMIACKCRQKDRASLFITDPKLELYSLHADSLRKNGYEVYLINLRSPFASECWNPLTPIFRLYQEYVHCKDTVETVLDEDHLVTYRFYGKRYTTAYELENAVKEVRFYLEKQVEGRVDDFCSMVVLNKNERDPYWEDSARKLLKAIILALLEDSEGDEPAVTEKNFSFRTIDRITADFKCKSSGSECDK